MNRWADVISRFEKSEDRFLLVVEEDGKAVSSVQVAIIEGLTHNVRPFAVIENVYYRTTVVFVIYYQRFIHCNNPQNTVYLFAYREIYLVFVNVATIFFDKR